MKSVNLGLLAFSLATLGASVQAAVPVAVTTAIGEMQTDGIAVATLVLVAVIALAAIKFIRRGM